MSEKKDGRKTNGGKRPGAGRKPANDPVEVGIAFKITEAEARLLAIVAEGESMTHRQILMAGVKVLMSKSVAEVLPPGAYFS